MILCVLTFIYGTALNYTTYIAAISTNAQFFEQLQRRDTVLF